MKLSQKYKGNIFIHFSFNINKNLISKGIYQKLQLIKNALEIDHPTKNTAYQKLINNLSSIFHLKASEEAMKINPWIPR